MVKQIKFHRDIPACNYCGKPLRVVEVHGHSQCSICKVNVDPCCSGEQCEIIDEYEGDDDETLEFEGDRFYGK